MADYVYLDWNVFNKIEKLNSLLDEEKQTYSAINDAIIAGKIVVPYSNAHMSDLHRGYIKDPKYTAGHLFTIASLTNHLCIVQYWGEKQVRWHYRDVNDFFESSIEESSYVAESFSDLLNPGGDSLLETLKEAQLNLLRSNPLPENFKEIYKADPIFSVMYPRSKVEMNQLALCEDLYAFSCKIKVDYNLYKNFRKYINQAKLKFQEVRKMDKEVSKSNTEIPSTLTYDEVWELYAPKNTLTSNPAYDKIFDLFTKTDLKGYNQDERFANLIDDALHVIYAAHCDYFVTIDNRCYEKALKVFHQLKIETKVMKPEDFVPEID